MLLYVANSVQECHSGVKKGKINPDVKARS